MRLISRLLEYHSPTSTSDYADDVVADLRAGRLVIVDQSTGDPDMNRAAGERLMWRVFNRQRQDFVQPRRDDVGAIVPPPEIIVYVEEAHNLLPAKADDLTTVWSRVAKEGSKFRIGLAYATQEPSSIQPNILKNTDNWFVAHLNNTDELRELQKYYDFEDFSQQILAVPEPGFLRMRTLSNPYTVPVQVDRFIVGP
jgi:DNA helicase HerA-like ATPase